MRRLSCWLGLTAFIALTGCNAVATRDIEMSSPWNAYEQMIISTRNGGVTLESGTAPEIRLAGTKRVNAARIEDAERLVDDLIVRAEPSPDDPATFLIELEVPDHLRSHSPGANFTVRVPQPCAAIIKTSNGMIHVSGMCGSVRLETSNGRIVATKINGSVAVTSSNGGVVVRDVTNGVSARTSNASVALEGIGGDCTIETSNGAVRVEKTRGSVQVTTSNGPIVVDAEPPDSGEVVLRSSNGGIHATVPRTMRADLRLATSNGRLNTNLNGTPLTTLRLGHNEIEGKLNGGGTGKLVAVSSNGSITLHCR